MTKTWLVLIAIGCGACSDEERPPPAPPVAVAVAAPSAAAPQRPIDVSLGAGFEMRRPVRDGRIAVIPIVAASPSSAEYLTLHDGTTRRLVTVRELSPAWEVDELRIRNKSALPLFVMRGELVEGGVQDRVIAQDRVIRPHEAAVVKVRCVEHDRQTGGKSFAAPGLLAELDLRRTVAYQPQEAVWAKVVQINQRQHLSPRTGTYRGAAAQQPTERRDRLAQQLAAHPDHDRIVGLAAVVDGEVVAIDRFASPELYRQLEGELLGSYVAGDDGTPHEGKTTLPDDVRALAMHDELTVTTDASTIVLRRL